MILFYSTIIRRDWSLIAGKFTQSCWTQSPFPNAANRIFFCRYDESLKAHTNDVICFFSSKMNNQERNAKKQSNFWISLIIKFIMLGTIISFAALVVVGCWMLCASLTPGAVPDVASRRGLHRGSRFAPVFPPVDLTDSQNGIASECTRGISLFFFFWERLHNH